MFILANLQYFRHIIASCVDCNLDPPLSKTEYRTGESVIVETRGITHSAKSVFSENVGYDVVVSSVGLCAGNASVFG